MFYKHSLRRYTHNCFVSTYLNDTGLYDTAFPITWLSWMYSVFTARTTFTIWELKHPESLGFGVLQKWKGRKGRSIVNFYFGLLWITFFFEPCEVSFVWLYYNRTFHFLNELNCFNHAQNCFYLPFPAISIHLALYITVLHSYPSFHWWSP